jgi:broad specificity phosphatase PhoE
MSTRLFLVRHGESIWNAEQRVQGQADPPLSTLGLQQASALAGTLRTRPLAAVYCSPLARARQTAAQISAPHGLSPCVEDALRELSLGEWQGQARAALHTDTASLYRMWCAHPMTVRPPGGETLHEALTRVGPAVESVVAQHPGATVVLVMHSIVGRVLLCHLLGTGLELVPRLKLKTASISVVRLTDGKAVLERLGDISHLGALRTPSAAERTRCAGAQSGVGAIL